MVTNPTIVDTATAAKTALDSAAREVRLEHSFNYLSPRSKPKNLAVKNSINGKNSQNKIIYNTPGRARSVELMLKDTDLRAGSYPQHNSSGCFTQNIEQLESVCFSEYQGMLRPEDLELRGFTKRLAPMTQKRLMQVAKQFSHMSLEAFKQMICVYDPKQRDYDVYVRKTKDTNESISRSLTETAVAVFNPNLKVLQFVQVIQRDHVDNIVNLKHIVFDAGEPIVVNEARLDQFGKLRQIAHVGDWGGTSQYLNSVERFDDGSIAWTITEQTAEANSASAILKEDGQIIILKNLETPLHHVAARNLGAEGIDASTGRWTGAYDEEAAKPEYDDKYILRREYKDSIRKQVYQIVDGAAVPGLVPIFDI